MTLPPRFLADAAPNDMHLRLLGTSDLHMHLMGYDYYADRPNPRVGLSRTATLIDQARSEAENSMLFDNGDLLQGNPMADLLASPSAQAPHPMIQAMNLLDYDAGTLGNHDFDYGRDFVSDTLKEAAFPFVLSNLYSDAPGEDLGTQDSALLRRRFTRRNGSPAEIRIGVLGFTPPQVGQWNRHHLQGAFRVDDIPTSAHTRLPLLHAAGADLIIALCHSGIGALSDTRCQENAATQLASIDGIDVVLSGHTHQLFPGPDHPNIPEINARRGLLAGTPAVMPGVWGSHLGQIDLLLRQEGTAWQIVAHECRLRPIHAPASHVSPAQSVAEHPAVVAAAAPVHQRTLRHIRKSVGHTSHPIHSFFAQVHDCPSVALVAEVQRRHLIEHLSGGAYADLPVLSAAAPFKVGGQAGPGYYTDIPAGEITIRHIADLYIHPNLLMGMRVSGAELRNWLERAASQFLPLRPGTYTQPLINARFPCYNFDTILGLSYQIDLSQPPRHDSHGTLVNPDARRIAKLRHKDYPIAEDDAFIIATNSYRAGGGGGLFTAAQPTPIYRSQDTIRDMLLRYIAQNGTLPTPPARSWHFAPLPDTRARFLSTPAAAAHLHSPDLSHIVPLGMAENGFHQYEITF